MSVCRCWWKICVHCLQYNVDVEVGSMGAGTDAKAENSPSVNAGLGARQRRLRGSSKSPRIQGPSSCFETLVFMIIVCSLTPRPLHLQGASGWGSAVSRPPASIAQKREDDRRTTAPNASKGFAAHLGAVQGCVSQVGRSKRDWGVEARSGGWRRRLALAGCCCSLTCSLLPS